MTDAAQSKELYDIVPAIYRTRDTGDLQRYFEAAGGFSDEPLFEEIRLVKKLRDAGSFEEIDLPIGVSPRRWERDGWLIRTLQNRLLVLGHRVGMPGHALARIYRRPARR